MVKTANSSRAFRESMNVLGVLHGHEGILKQAKTSMLFFK